MDIVGLCNLTNLVQQASDFSHICSFLCQAAYRHQMLRTKSLHHLTDTVHPIEVSVYEEIDAYQWKPTIGYPLDKVRLLSKPKQLPLKCSNTRIARRRDIINPSGHLFVG